MSTARMSTSHFSNYYWCIVKKIKKQGNRFDFWWPIWLTSSCFAIIPLSVHALWTKFQLGVHYFVFYCMLTSFWKFAGVGKLKTSQLKEIFFFWKEIKFRKYFTGELNPPPIGSKTCRHSLSEIPQWGNFTRVSFRERAAFLCRRCYTKKVLINWAYLINHLKLMN